jgi:uncharacterized protein YhfF
MTQIPVPEEHDDRVRAFWYDAKQRARLASMPGYFGPSALESLIPPAWSLGGTPEEADALVERLLRDRQATVTVPLTDFEDAGESMPSVGALGIVLDGHGAPRALVVTTEVQERGGEVVEVMKVLHAG